MSLDNYIALLSTAISFLGLLLVVLQLREGVRERRSESLVEIYDINRELLSLGFEHPALFAIFEDAKDVNPVLERRYLQLWLNQFSLIHSYLNDSVFRGELKESLIRDLSDFLAQENMQRHWKRYGAFYPVSFQTLVNGIIQKNEPPFGETAAHLDSGA
jgi:hypothetical protein